MGVRVELYTAVYTSWWQSLLTVCRYDFLLALTNFLENFRGTLSKRASRASRDGPREKFEEERSGWQGVAWSCTWLFSERNDDDDVDSPKGRKPSESCQAEPEQHCQTVCGSTRAKNIGRSKSSSQCEEPAGVTPGQERWCSGRVLLPRSRHCVQKKSSSYSV